jgi:hypothetical protein
MTGSLADKSPVYVFFCNQTLVEWLSKSQVCIQTAAFGSEFVAERVTVDHIIDLTAMFNTWNVPIQKKSFIFGDNQAVVNIIAIPHPFLACDTDFNSRTELLKLSLLMLLFFLGRLLKYTSRLNQKAFNITTYLAPFSTSSIQLS